MSVAEEAGEPGRVAGGGEAVLLNRSALLHAIDATIRDAVANGTTSAAAFMDVNAFTEVNATWGPEVGDEVLDLLGRRIVERAGDAFSGTTSQMPICGRLDADHFVVIVPGIDQYRRMPTAVSQIVRDLAQPLVAASHSIALSVRAAVVQIPEHARSVTSVLGTGFQLLNGTARGRLDGIVFSEANTSLLASAATLEQDLVRALEGGQISLALQPKMLVRTGIVDGAEALARWTHPVHGMVPPESFIEIAERTGLVFEIGLRILRGACRAANALSAISKDFSIAVNVSPRQLASEEFLGAFLEVVDREGTAPERLQVEVTESAAMSGGELSLNSLRVIRRCGIGVAIDDFGTGFSNLASLSALPADTLKIDRSLVVGTDDGERSGMLLRVAVQLARTFGLKTVAEGVETARQFAWVRDLGCDYVQGFFVGRPVALAEFAGLYLDKDSVGKQAVAGGSGAA